MQITPPGMALLKQQNDVSIATPLPFGAWTTFLPIELAPVWTVAAGDLIMCALSVRATLGASTLFQIRFIKDATSVAALEPLGPNTFLGLQQERFAAGAGASILSMSGIWTVTTGGTLILNCDGFVDVANGNVAAGDAIAKTLWIKP